LDQPSPGSNSTENSYYGFGKKNAKRSYDDGAGSGNQIIGSIHDGYLEDHSQNNHEHQILNIKGITSKRILILNSPRKPNSI